MLSISFYSKRSAKVTGPVIVKREAASDKNSSKSWSIPLFKETALANVFDSLRE